MRAKEFTQLIENLQESPEIELAKKLPTLAKHDYDTIDKLMRKIAKKHRISAKSLHNKFVKKYRKIPDNWIRDKLKEGDVIKFPGKKMSPLSKASMGMFGVDVTQADDVTNYRHGIEVKRTTQGYAVFVNGKEKFVHDDSERAHEEAEELQAILDDESDEVTESKIKLDIPAEVDKFADWACKILKVERKPKITLSMDTEEAQTHHHTGRHIHGDDKIWVYAKNRNLVDILRTVFHELVHVRQGEKGEIGPNASYPGSPIEREADMLAGKWIKIYGEHNHHIFQ